MTVVAVLGRSWPPLGPSCSPGTARRQPLPVPFSQVTDPGGHLRGIRLKDLEALPWNSPQCVQVMLHDEEDDCFGLWMFRDGKRVELRLPGTERFHDPAPPTQGYAPHPGHLWRTDVGARLPEQTPEELRDPRPAW